LVLATALLISAGCRKGAVVNDRAQVEAVVRASETAFAALDCDHVDSYTAPGARWLEGGPPESAENADWCRKAKSAGVRISYDLHDFVVELAGDAAWVTLIVDGSFSAGTPEARALMNHGPSDPSEWRKASVESVVLRRIGKEWKIVLGHDSDLIVSR
jgi:hypothetical protein